ncbi:MAG: hypothetical protein RMJ84_02045 [Sandaracinaceae bacterium]|nr:hypothetical protein [Sandaracinaceae bacterium]
MNNSTFLSYHHFKALLVGFVQFAGAVHLVAGCGGGSKGNPTDAGPQVMDGGPIVLPDTGPRRDAISMPPSDVCGSVAGSSAAWPPLPPSCLPRCSPATAMAVERCQMMHMNDQMRLSMCIDQALMSDRTPSARLHLGEDAMGRSIIATIDCGGNGDNWSCLAWQDFSCVGDQCPDQLRAFIRCAVMVMNPNEVRNRCMSEIMALNQCLMMRQSAYRACLEMRIPLCFQLSGGALPSDFSWSFGSDHAHFLRFLEHGLPIPQFSAHH